MSSLFFSYSHVDEGLRDQLEIHLAMLKRQGIIETWHDRRIVAGDELDAAIGEHVENDDIILLLVSPDFLASRYCYDVEMTRAMDRHVAGEAIVIPVILRPSDWHTAPFGKLMATPRDGRPVTQCPDRDVAFLEIVKAIREAVEQLARKKGTSPRPSGQLPTVSTPDRALAPVQAERPRSSNLALTKRFTDRDRDEFRIKAFEYMASFFENSVAELGARNEGVQGSFRRVDANRFFVTAYRDGKAVSRMTVFMGGSFGNGITQVDGETTTSNTSNGHLSIDADDQSMFLKSTFSMTNTEAKLTFEGAAETFWAGFVRPLQYR